MARDELQQASELLRQAAERADDDDLEARIYDQSNAMAELATRREEPTSDHLDEAATALESLADDLAAHGGGDDPGEAKADVTEAYGHLRDYRENAGE